jgi:hypothetical protein
MPQKIISGSKKSVSLLRQEKQNKNSPQQKSQEKKQQKNI